MSKFCVNCRYIIKPMTLEYAGRIVYTPQGRQKLECGHPDVSTVDLVTGRVVARYSCEAMRIGEMCGPEGLLYKQIEM
jgi:hypothetical protein